MNVYEVALWRWWPTSDFPVIDDVEADSPLLAVLTLMQQAKLKAVSRAAVKCADQTFVRWEQGVKLYVEHEKGSVPESLGDEEEANV